MDGRTVFPALASINHRFEFGRGTRKSTSKLGQFDRDSRVGLCPERGRRLPAPFYSIWNRQGERRGAAQCVSIYLSPATALHFKPTEGGHAWKGH